MTLAARLPAAKDGARDKAAFRRVMRLLAWYDRHRRELPWRARAGERMDAYRVWLSEIMLQQTTVRAVAPYFEKFTALWPDVAALAAAERENVMRAWAGLGYYSRARNLHSCAQVIAREHGGVFPRDARALGALPGIGPYTAAAIGAIAFDEAVMPVDGNIERVMTRLFAIEEALPKSKPMIHARADEFAPHGRAGDVAQALMDLGAGICTPKNPSCPACPFEADCAARARGDMETFPRKTPKKTGKTRRGAAFVVVRADGKILLRTRPDKGLLGGMSEVPGTEWRADFDEARAKDFAPLKVPRWRKLPGVVTHVFTHFPLELSVYVGHVPSGTRAPKGMRWVRLEDVAGEALPNVMRKVLTHGGIV